MEYKGCGNCDYWLFHRALDTHYSVGYCHKGAPGMDEYGYARWPMTDGGEVCGDHEPIKKEDESWVVMTEKLMVMKN